MELALIPNNTPENVLNTQITLGEISFDVDLIRNTVKNYLSKYDGLVVQESDIKIIKGEVAFLRKQKTLINKNRIELSKEFDKPLVQYKSDCDSIIDEIENVIVYLNDQLNDFEERRKDLKKQQVEDLMNKVRMLKHMPDNFEFIFEDSFLNATKNLTKIKEELFEQCNQYEIMKQLEKEIEEKIKAKKILLEDLISKYNEKLDIAHRLRYTDYEHLIDELDIMELDNYINFEFQRISAEIRNAEIKEIEAKEIHIKEADTIKQKYIIKTSYIGKNELEKLKEFMRNSNIDFEIEKVIEDVKIDAEFEIYA